MPIVMARTRVRTMVDEDIGGAARSRPTAPA
jgi:hypothetical protein